MKNAADELMEEEADTLADDCFCPWFVNIRVLQRSLRPTEKCSSNPREVGGVSVSFLGSPFARHTSAAASALATHPTRLDLLEPQP